MRARIATIHFLVLVTWWAGSWRTSAAQPSGSSSAAPQSMSAASVKLADVSPSSPQQQQQQRRGRRFGRAQAGVYKSRINAHWFHDNTRFWYRNDLRDGAREFILVDAETGTREPAFDHAAVARQMGEDVEPTKLPVDELEFSEDGQTVKLMGNSKTWELNLQTGRLQAAPPETAESGGRGLPATLRPRPSTRTGPDTEITFENKLDTDVELFWIDDSGNRQSYGTLAAGEQRVQHTFGGHVWLVANEAGTTLAVFEAADTPDVAVIDETRPQRPERRARRGRGGNGSNRRSPDGQWTALVKDHNVFIRSTEDESREIQLSEDGKDGLAYGRFSWSPDSKTLVAWRIEPGDRKDVYLIRSSPPGGGRAQLETRPYALPGDKFTTYELNMFDVASRKQLKPEVDRFEHEWLSPQPHWDHEGRAFTYSQEDRGHQRFRVIEVNADTGVVRNIVDERSKTFIWTAHTENLHLDLVNWLENTDEIIYVSEQDGWRHLYLVDVQTGSMKQITKGEWVVRGIQNIDEEKRQIWFSAGGMNPDQDPYFLHYYRINFDGTGLVALTEGNGSHSIDFSPDRKYLIDTYSRVDMPPVNELRRASDGRLVCPLEEADISELKEKGWTAPESFVAKGRDGKTGIWGIIYRPKDFDPGRKYPVVESIYAGPQGSFVPKTFSASSRFQSYTDLGFVVVQVDGMGTANRSKAFHDVCWKNLKDAGFPDRILWHKAVAAKYPWYDISRVGIFGTSAGGQNAAAALLFHPEFYKVAVANSGCHDNRMDKASWNEQWMGYPVGPQYSECSNIDNAGKLQGHLFLIVGEMDHNVPPESTLRFVDALIDAGKDFDLLVVPNADHGIRGPHGAYAQRRTRDFFVRYLQGTELPNRNATEVEAVPAGS